MLSVYYTFILLYTPVGIRYLGGKLTNQLLETERDTEYVVDSDINILRGYELKLSPGKLQPSICTVHILWYVQLSRVF